MDLFIPRAPSDYLAILRRRRVLFLAPFLSVLALTQAVLPFLPRTYEATVTMLMEEDSFLNPAAARDKDLELRPKMEKQLRILSTEVLSFPNLEKIVRDKNVGLGDPSTSPARTAALVARLKKHLILKMPSEGVLVLTYEGATAHGVQRVINAIARNMVEKNRQDKLTQAQSSVEFTASQLRVYKERLQNSEESFFMNKVDTELSDAEARREVLRERVDELQKTVAVRSAKEENPQLVEMRRELNRTESLLKQLELNSKGDNAMIQGTREKIDSLKKQLAFEESSQAGEETSGMSPEFEQADRELKELEAHIKTLEQRREDLASGRLRPKNMTERELLAVEREKKLNEDIYQALRARLENVEISQQMDALGHSRRLEIIDPARLPEEPTQPDPMMLWAVGVAAALLSGAVAVAARELSDTSLRHGADAEEYLGMPPLRVLPSLDATPSTGNAAPLLAALHQPESPAAEAVRLLRTTLLSLDPEKPFKALILTGAAVGDGCSVLAANLAVSLARELSKKVLLLDADLARGRAAGLLGLPDGAGLGDYLNDPNAPAPSPRRTSVDNLWVLPAGRSLEAPSRFFGLDRMDSLMARFRGEYDFILIDAPPACDTADVPVLLNQADAVLLTARRGKTPRAAVRRALDVLNASPKARPIGYVLTDKAPQ